MVNIQKNQPYFLLQIRRGTCRETVDRDRTYHDVTKHTGIFCWQELDLREISTRVELSHRCGVTLIHSLHRFALKLDSSLCFSLFEDEEETRTISSAIAVKTGTCCFHQF